MATVRQYKITFKNIKEGQISCSNPTIKIYNVSENIIQNCVFDSSTNSVTFSVYEDAVDGLQGTCINFSIQCESCGKCPPVHGQLCFCNDFTDCPDCHDCINGICVNRCPDKVCVDGRCSDCENNADCPGNQICVSGRCQCPPSLPYWDEVAQRCYGCKTDLECGPCHRCIDGECVKLACICDEELDQCVECVTTSDCGTNECCVNNKCECCPGYIWDAVLEECVEAPECQDEDYCEECENCVNGDCVPVICPDPNQICIDGQCVDIPCEGACEDATDCGPGCGCLNGQCVDCESLDCVTCAETIGCKCVNGNCVEDTDPCAKYSCLTNCGDRPDCECQEDGSCEEKECEGESTLEKNEDNCQLVYNLETTECCECSPITLDNQFMSAQISGNQMILVSRVEVRKGSVNSPFAIFDIHRVDEDQYDDIMDNEEPTQGQVRVTATYTYEGLSGSGNPNGIITTETVNLSPVFDLAGVGYSQQNISINIPGNQYPSGIRLLRNVKLTYTLISELTFESGCTYDQNTIIGTYEFGDYQTGQAWAQELNIDTPGYQSNAHYWIAKVLNTDTCRNPEAKWYKAVAGTNGEITTFETVPFRKTYLTKLTPTTYTDYISQPDENDGPSDNHGELFSGYYYKVATDCACNNEATAYYESTCQNPGRLVFCDPNVADILFDPCGKKITFNSSFVTDCIPNYDYYGDNASFVPDAAKLRYSIHVNGSDTPLTGSTKIADVNGLIYNAGQQFTATELIEYIEIKFSHDNCDECTIRVESDVDLDLPAYSVICEPVDANNTTFIITFTGWTGITSVTVNGNTATSGSPTVSITVVNGTTSLVGNVQFTGCPGTVPMDIQLPENCCDDLLVLLTQNVNDCDAPNYEFTATPSPNIPGTYSFSVNGVPAATNTTGLFSTPKNSGGDEPNTVSVIFNPDAAGCENVVNSVEVDKTVTLTIGADKQSNYSFCGNGVSTITYETNGYTGDVTYNVTGVGNSTVTLNGSQDLLIPVSGVIGNTKVVTILSNTLQDINGNTCVAFDPEIITINWIDEPDVTSITFNPVSACEGEAVTFVVNGTGDTATINAVNFTGTVPSTVNIGQTYTVYVGTTGTATITVLGANAGDCSSVENVFASVVVNDAPEITDFEYVCETPGNPSSDIAVTIYGTAAATVTVSADEGTVATVESPAGVYNTVVNSSNGGDSITVNMTKAGCTDSATYELEPCDCDGSGVADIEYLGNPFVTDSACVGDSHTYDAVASGGNPPYTYEWFVDNVYVDTGISYVHTFTTAGTFSLRLEVEDNAGCTFSVTRTIVGNAIPTVSVVGDSSPCLNEATNYTASVINGPVTSYQWYVDAVPVSTSATFTYTPLDLTPHDITVEIVNSNGCASAVSAALTTTAIDCCEVCLDNSVAYVKEMSYNRMRDTNSIVHVISPAITFECVDPGDPSAVNDAAASALETFLAGLSGQCGTPSVTWATANSGTSVQCLSETFTLNVVGGDTGIYYRGLDINGTDYGTLATQKLVNVSGGLITGYVNSQAWVEAYIEDSISDLLNSAGSGCISVNVQLPAAPAGGSSLQFIIDITGVNGDTISFRHSTLLGGPVTETPINNAACLSLVTSYFPGGCIELTVTNTSIVPGQLYNSSEIDDNKTSQFDGPCNPV